MSDSNEFFDKEELDAIIERFKLSVEKNEPEYFESEELIAVSNYFLEQNNLPLAKKAIDLANEIYTDNEEVLILKISYNVASSNLNEAEKIAYDYIGTHPDTVDVRLILSSVLKSSGKFDEALDILKEAKNIDPDSPAVFTAFGLLYQAFGHYEKSNSYLKKALSINSDDISVFNVIITNYQISDKIEEGIEYLKGFIEENPFNKHAWCSLAFAYTFIDESEKAIEAYDYALAIDPSYTNALFAKGNTYYVDGDYENASKCFIETVNDPEYESLSYYFLGDINLRDNKTGLAADYFQKSIEKRPIQFQAYIGLTICLQMMGLFNDALRIIEDAERNHPKRSEIHHIKGTVLMDLERYNDAVKTLRQAVRLESDNEDVWLDLSEATYYESGINEALKILDEAEEMFDEENAMIVYRKAAFLFEEGKNQKAVSQLLRGLSIDAEMYTSIYSFNQDLEKNEIIQEIVTMFLNQ